MPGLRYIKISNSITVANYLVQKINGHLVNEKRVLWLVAGGSAMDIAVEAAAQLQNIPNLNLLTITLTDERFGEVGHAGSNWKQLADRRFKLPGAVMLPVLSGKSIEQTADDYEKMLNQQLSGADFSIALAGMGTDGHIFGIKPKSPAAISNKAVVAYKWDDYDRITPTISLIKRIDEVVIYAAGQQKHAQFDLLEKEVDPRDQPAQLLKQLKDVTIFNDYRGNSA